MPAKKGKADHVLLQGNEFVCKHCGDRYTPSMPCSITIFGAMADAFGKDHRRCKKNPEVEKREAARVADSYKFPESWALGPQGDVVGSSSATIWHVATGLPLPQKGPVLGSTPRDPADFGRCYRLLRAFNWMESYLPAVADNYRAWRPLVREWSELTKLYEQELPSGDAPLLYALLQKLNTEGAQT